jgi:four helix bundle protein
MTFKFERLEVWQLSLKYIDTIYQLADNLPASENYNLTSQIRRAATSVSLNIAEGSTGQSDAEQHRFLGLSLRSLIETVACLRIIRQRQYLNDNQLLEEADSQAQILAKKIHAFRKALNPKSKNVREQSENYFVDGEF